MKIRSFIVGMALAILLSCPQFIHAQKAADSTAIRAILEEETAAWNKGDAVLYSNHFAADGNFTNILGAFYEGKQEFLTRHEQIFKGLFRQTTLSQQLFSLRFLTKDIAVVQSLSTVSGFSPAGPPKGSYMDEKGHLHTKLLQVMKKEGADWKIVVYHNIDVKQGIPVTEQD